MLRAKSIAGRLARLYAVALFAGLLVFAALALVVIDAVQRASANAALTSSASSAAVLIEPGAGATGLDPEDASAFRHALGTHGNAAFFDASGKLAFATVIDLPDVIAALGVATIAAARTADVDGAQIRVVAQPVQRRGRRLGTVVVWRAIDEIADIDRRVALGFALAIPLLVFVALGAGHALAHRALEPLRAISVLATEIEASDLSRRLGNEGDDELGRLCATFNRMIGRLEEAFARQRQFASDVAHELRAPLAVAIVEIDIARRKARSVPFYEHVLDVVRDKAMGMDRLTTDLLASYLDDGPQKLSSFPLRDAMRDAAATLEPLLAAHHVMVEIVADADAPIVADRNEVIRALIALLDNARKYGGNGTRIRADVDATPDAVRATVRDSGPGFSAQALQRATERFWSGPNGNDPRGTGLGLSLVAAIVRRAGGTLQLSNGPPGGALVELTFPRPTDIY